eukprot:1506215-Rhodomonas_salina.1
MITVPSAQHPMAIAMSTKLTPEIGARAHCLGYPAVTTCTSRSDFGIKYLQTNDWQMDFQGSWQKIYPNQ